MSKTYHKLTEIERAAVDHYIRVHCDVTDLDRDAVHPQISNAQIRDDIARDGDMTRMMANYRAHLEMRYTDGGRNGRDGRG